VSLAAFAGWGFELAGRRWVWARGAAWVALAAWGITSYAALWVRHDSPQTYTSYAAVMTGDKRYEDAVRWCDNALQIDVQDPEAWRIRGESLSDMERHPEALRDLQECVRLNPRDAQAYLEMGSIYLRNGQAAAAEAAARQARKEDPQNAYGLLMLGQSLAVQGKYEEAAGALREGLGMLPDKSAAHRILGSVYQAVGRYQESRRHLEYSVHFAPRDPVALTSLSWFLSTCPRNDLRDGAAAVRLGERAAELSRGPDLIQALRALAAARAETGQFAAAVELGEALVKRLRELKAEDMAAQMDAELQFYRAGRPYRDAGREARGPEG